jgi:hypothetical protein
MEAPPSRYRVVEKDGRLVVVDTATGATARPVARPGTAPAPSAAPVAAGRGLIDAVADTIAAWAGKGRDSEGRMVIAWEWEQNGKKRRWNAALDAGQQRRLGRALLWVIAPGPLALLLILAGGPFLFLFAALPFILWGVALLNRLQSETGVP